MTFEDLFNNPEEYRDGENYRATNITFPVFFKGESYIVKTPRRTVSPIIELYCWFQDQFFYRARKLTSAKKELEAEKSKLEALDGEFAPRFIAYQDGILVREFLKGSDFRSLSSDQDRKATLDGALVALEEFHRKGIIIDAHVKNSIMTIDEIVFWLDLGGISDESDLTAAKAINLLKFIYSTYTATRNPDIAIYSAELVWNNYTNQEVRNAVRELVSPGLSALRLWFPTRIPINGRLNDDIKNILSSYRVLRKS